MVIYYKYIGGKYEDINNSDDELSEVQKDMSPKAIKKKKNNS